MRGLTDQQLGEVMLAARALPVEKRDVFLQRLSAMLHFRAHTAAYVAEVVKLAMAGLVQQSADSVT